MAFLMSLFGAISATEASAALLDKWMTVLLSAYSAFKKEKEGAAIDTSTKEAGSVKTSDDVKKAAEDSANALRNL